MDTILKSPLRNITNIYCKSLKKIKKDLFKRNQRKIFRTKRVIDFDSDRD